MYSIKSRLRYVNECECQLCVYECLVAYITYYTLKQYINYVSIQICSIVHNPNSYTANKRKKILTNFASTIVIDQKTNKKSYRKMQLLIRTNAYLFNFL